MDFRRGSRGRWCAAGLVLGILGGGGSAWGINIFELERMTTQRRLDEAWANSLESRIRRGGLHVDEGIPTMFAASLLLEVTPDYAGGHLLASMVQFPEEFGGRVGVGLNLGFSQYAAGSSVFSEDEREASSTHAFVGLNLGIEQVFLEIGYRGRLETVNQELLGQLPASRAAGYQGLAAEQRSDAPFFRVRWGSEQFAVRAFLEPGEVFKDPVVAYLEPEHRLRFGEGQGLTSQLSYRRVSLPGAAPRARLALTETFQLGEWESYGTRGRYVDRPLVRASLESYSNPETQSLWEALGVADAWAFRVETEPYYAGAWYSPRFGFGWGLGLAGTSEWDDDGSTMRVVLRYVRNYIQPEPSLSPVTPWLFEFSAVAGF